MTVAEVQGARAQIERLLLSRTFETSEAHRRLLAYLAEKSLSGEADRLKEYAVGIDAFGKPANYDPQEDSIVRTHAGRLRFKLREYYEMEGKDDPISVELPKGGFRLVFRPRPEVSAAQTAHAPLEAANGVTHEQVSRIIAPSRSAWLPWVLSAIFATACFMLSYQALALQANNQRLLREGQVPWPLSRVVNSRQSTVIVGADAGFARLRFLNGRSSSLKEYLTEDFPKASLPRAMTERESKLMSLLFYSTTLTTYSTVQNVKTIVGLSGQLASRVTVRSAREFQSRDFGDGNYILMGSPISNPWVSLFDHFLNFQEVDQMADQTQKYFLNKHPRPGELERYEASSWTGATGTAYATMALVPNEQHIGNILILQGLQGEGTEAAATFLSVQECQTKLRQALLKIGADPDKAWFEALISSEAVAGTPREITVVAVRQIQ